MRLPCALLISSGLAAAMVPPDALPGVWREVEDGAFSGAVQRQRFANASGGTVIGGFERGHRVHLDVALPESQRRARLYLRYSNAMSGTGAVEVRVGDRSVGRLVQTPSARWDAFRWTSLELGGLPSGTTRIELICPADASCGGLDALGVVDDAWDGRYLPPDTFRDGRPVGAGSLRLDWRTYWVGNTFEGAEGNGFGRWVGNFIDDLAVGSDGTVVAGAHWDEAGRCVGVYRDGDVNRNLLKRTVGKPRAWGWGTANRAVAIDGSTLFVGGEKGDLLTFALAGRLADEHRNTATQDLGALRAMAVANGRLVTVAADGSVAERDPATPAVILRSFAGGTAKAVQVDAAGRVWLLADGAVRAHTWDGSVVVGPLPALARPVALDLAADGSLLVCDDATDQVVVFSLAGAPRESARWGQAGGMAAGVPGEVKPDKFWALRGAGTDAAGNRYVAMSRSESVIRSFAPDGSLRWQVEGYPFTCSWDFDRTVGGRHLYGIDEIVAIEPPGEGPLAWRLRSLTVDPSTPGDPRLARDGGARGATHLRRHGERRLLFNQGMVPTSGYAIYAFHRPVEQVAVPAGRVAATAKNSWAWCVDDEATVWEGSGAGGIRRHRLTGFDEQGQAQYVSEDGDVTPRPACLASVARIQYDRAADRMILSGDAPGRKSKSWGLAGTALVVIPGWSAGNREPSVTIDLPVDDEGLQPKSWTAEDQHIFVIACKETRGANGVIHVYEQAGGRRLGQIKPGPDVGGQSGWIDIPYAIKAMRQPDGAYWLLVEEEWRGRQLLHVWRP